MNNPEELVWNNVLSYRNDPEDKPTMYTRQELTEIILKERREREDSDLDEMSNLTSDEYLGE